METARQQILVATLEKRFRQNMHRHPDVDWTDVHTRLKDRSQALETLGKMDDTGGEPDVIGNADSHGAYLFCDCAAESPQGRRSLCYDAEALASRKANKPQGSAVDLAAAMGAQLLTEARYRQLQQVGEFDLKTSSWVATPAEIRKLGGALFCDRRYGQVFVYHNGAESYYAARGFRASVSV